MNAAAWIALAVGAVLTAVLAAVLAELALRSVFRRGRYLVWPPHQSLDFDPDKATHPYYEPLVRWRVNSDGERGSEAPPSDGLYRVLVVGGSAVECYLLDQPTSWPGALELELQKGASLEKLGARRVHLGAIGLSGVDSGSLDYILERVLPNYERIDLLLIMVGASDVLRWMERGAPPDRPCEPMTVDECFARHPEKPFGWSPRRLALREWARRVRDRRPVRKHRVAKWFAKARTMRQNAKEIRDEVPDSAIVLRTFDDKFRSVLRRAQAGARRVIVVRQPWFEKQEYTPEEQALFWNGGAGKAYLEEVSAYYSDRVLNALMRQLDTRAKQVADEVGVEQLDLMPILAPDAAHYVDHFHFTPAACAKIADVLATMVLRDASKKSSAAA